MPHSCDKEKKKRFGITVCELGNDSPFNLHMITFFQSYY